MNTDKPIILQLLQSYQNGMKEFESIL